MVDTGKYRDIIKGISSLEKSSDVTKTAQEIASLLDGVSSLDDVNLILKEAGISKDIAKEALKYTDFANSLDDVADKATGIKNVDKALDGLDDSSDIVDDMGNAFKGAGQKIGGFLKTAGPILLFAAAVAGTAIAIKNYYEKFDKLVETAETSQSAYSDTAAEIKNLQSEIDSTTAKIEELEAQGELTITEQGELERLRNQNLELERQKKLKEEIAGQQSQQATDDAMEALTLERTQDLTQKNRVSGSSRHDFVDQTEYIQTDVVTATKNEVAVLEELKEQRNALLNDDIDDAEQTDLFNSLDSEIDKYESEISTNLESIASLRNNFIDQSTGLLKENLTEEQKELFYSMTKIIDDFNNIDLTGAEKEFSKIESFFDGSSGKNAIEEQLRQSVKAGGDLEQELNRLGLTLDDLGIENISSLSDYFNEASESAEEAKKTVQDYASTVADIEKASESADQDKNWSTVSEAYKEAKELLKEGKTGTDNFQSMASFLNPAKVKELAEEGGKYTADAYQKAFEEVKKTANRWFGEDETKSMENFVNDFKKKGLFDVKTDDMGLWDITTNFKTTAEAAKEFDMSVESVETMLEALSAYGYDFSNIMFSGDGLEKFEGKLTSIKTLYESLEDGSTKENLGKMIENWDSELETYKEDLNSLTEPKIVQIEFQYDIAQIDAEIDNLRNRHANGDELTRSDYASWIASYDQKDTKQKETFGLDEVEITNVKIADAAVEEARNNLSKAVSSGEGVIEAQVALIAVQESRDALMDEFNSWNLEQEVPIIADSSTEEVEDAWEKFLSEPRHLNIEAELSDDDIESQLKNLKEGSTITFHAKSGDGFEEIEAKLNEKGEIVYYSTLDDGSKQQVELELNETGTLSLTATNNTQQGVSDANASLGSLENPDVEIKVDNSVALTKISNTKTELDNLDGKKAHTYITVHRTNVGPDFLLGTAHNSGTAHVLGTSSSEHPIPKYSTRALAMGSLKNTSWLKDDWKTAKDEVALTGELGRELVVSGNRWWTVGDNGAGFAHIPAGSVVFNHKQTEELLSKGYTNSRGKAHLEGTAYRLGNYNGTGHAKTETVKTSSKTTKNATKALDAIAQWFDWIEVRLDRLARDSENAEKAIERAVGLSKTLSATNKAITAANKEQEAAEKGAARYLKAAQTVAKNTGLSASLQKKVQNGTIDISKYGETTQKKIQEYQNYYEKYLDCLDQVADLEDQAIELALSRLDKITEYYEAVNSVHESLIDANDAKLDYREAMGYSAVSSTQKELLQSSIDEAKAIRDNAYTNYTKYQSEFNSLLKSGVLKKDSVEYYDRLSEINDLKADYYEASTAVLEHADALREIEYTKLQNAIDRFSRAFEKIDLQLELAESRNEKVDESLYQEQIGLNNEELIKQYELKVKKMAEQANYALDSERYKELAEEIADIDGEINGLLISNEELKDSIFELRFNPLEESVGSLRDVRAEFEDFKSLLNEEAFFDSETGALTSEGVAQIYLIEQSMISAKQEVAEYTEGLEKLRQNYESGLISEKEFNEKNAEYREGIRDAISDVKDYGDALSDLYITQMEKENEVLQEVIDKRKEALQRKEDYYNYDKTIRNQTKDLNMLRAQAAALEGANDATSIAQLKKLRQEIADAEDELSETKRQHSVEMQETGYDELSQDLDDILADTTLEIKTNADKQLSIIDEMLTQTVNKYAQAYESINKIIAQTGFVGSEAFNESLSQLQSQTGAESQKDKATTSQSNTSATEPVQNIETDKIKDIDTSKIEESIQTPENTKNRPVVKITPSKTSVSVMEGKTTSISCTVLPSDAKNKNLSWKSSNKSIATVSNGKIKGVKAGSCTITIAASDGSGTKASVSVTVTSAPKKENSPTAKDLIIAPTTKPTTTTTATSSGGNGKITKGEKVTFASGKYTASSDGSGTTGKSRLGKSVYIAKVKSGATRPYLLSSDKAGKNLLGWVKKSQLKGYASGTKGTTQDEWARIYEKGNEIVTLPDGSVLTKLPKGTGVIPNNLTENLWGLARSADDIMASTVGNAMKYINNVVNNGGNNITYHYDSLLTVEGNVDKDVLPRLEEILKKSYQYTSEHMYKDAVKLGFRKR